ncbi:Copia protein, partial [Mucuna pruriens]
MKELEELKYFLGIEVAYSKQGIFISQRKYVLDLLKETGKLGCKTSGVPIEQNHRIECEESPIIEKSKYQRLVGKLIYLSHTRLDIAYVVITWRSKKQNVVARSSVEVEFQVMAQGTCEGLWMKIILDNLKHIEIDKHFIKEKLDSGLIVTAHVPIGLQVADVFTKGLPTTRFQELNDKLGMIDIHLPT